MLRSRMTSRDLAWKLLMRSSFAVLSHVTPGGRPRSTGVVYAAGHQRLYVAVEPDGWDVLHLPAFGEVAITVPVRRGGPLSLLVSISPASISFHGWAMVHPPGASSADVLASGLLGRVPADRLANCRIVEIAPQGRLRMDGADMSPLKSWWRTLESLWRDPEAAQPAVGTSGAHGRTGRSP